MTAKTTRRDVADMMLDSRIADHKASIETRLIAMERAIADTRRCVADDRLYSSNMNTIVDTALRCAVDLETLKTIIETRALLAERAADTAARASA